MAFSGYIIERMNENKIHIMWSARYTVCAACATVVGWPIAAKAGWLSAALSVFVLGVWIASFLHLDAASKKTRFRWAILASLLSFLSPVISLHLTGVASGRILSSGGIVWLLGTLSALAILIKSSRREMGEL